MVVVGPHVCPEYPSYHTPCLSSLAPAAHNVSIGARLATQPDSVRVKVAGLRDLTWSITHGARGQGAMGDTEFSTLVQLLQHRAHHQPDRCAYTVLAENGSTEVSVTYRQLERQAQAIAARFPELHEAAIAHLGALPSTSNPFRSPHLYANFLFPLCSRRRTDARKHHTHPTGLPAERG